MNPLRYTVDLEASQKADQMDADQKGARRACLLLSVLSLLATFVLTGLYSFAWDGYYVRLPTLLAVVLIWPFSVPLQDCDSARILPGFLLAFSVGGVVTVAVGLSAYLLAVKQLSDDRK